MPLRLLKIKSKNSINHLYWLSEKLQVGIKCSHTPARGQVCPLGHLPPRSVLPSVQRPRDAQGPRLNWKPPSPLGIPLPRGQGRSGTCSQPGPGPGLLTLCRGCATSGINTSNKLEIRQECCSDTPSLGEGHGQPPSSPHSAVSSSKSLNSAKSRRPTCEKLGGRSPQKSFWKVESGLLSVCPVPCR